MSKYRVKNTEGLYLKGVKKYPGIFEIIWTTIDRSASMRLDVANHMAFRCGGQIEKA